MAQSGHAAATPLWIMDREAYNERRAIMEIENCGALTASRAASDYAYNTRFGKVATEASNGNWEPAGEWCAEIAERFGKKAADQLIGDIDDAIEAEVKWRR